MYKSRLILLFMALLSTLVLLISLVGCGSSGTTATSTSTPAVTESPTSASTSGKTLYAILGWGKNLGDIQFDVVASSTQLPGMGTGRVYYKNYGLENEFKFRTDATIDESNDETLLADFSTNTAYRWYRMRNIAYEEKLSPGKLGDLLANADSNIYPTYIGSDTVDGHLCDVWQYGNVSGNYTWTEMLWVWKDKSFPVKQEITDSNSTKIIEFKNIVFGSLSDSLFKLPAGVKVMQSPSYTP